MVDNPGDNGEGRDDMVRDRDDVAAGRAIRRSREAQGMTQFDLAVKANIRGGGPEVSKFEKGERHPNLENWFKICKALGWPVPPWWEKPEWLEAEDDSALWLEYAYPPSPAVVLPGSEPMMHETLSAVR
jgi:transcriptional regulator with XRE-family HTH domain